LFIISRQQLKQLFACQIIKLLEKLLSCKKSTINYLIKSVRGLADLPRSSRLQKTTIKIGCIIKRKSVNDVYKISRDIARELISENITNVNSKMVV